MRPTFHRLGALFAFLGLALLAACAQQVGDIDRTQPNKLEKSAFEGEWYIQQTVVGVNATAISSFVGLEGQTERVEFEIEEDYLLGFRTHEDVFNVDRVGLTGDDEFEHGRPVIAFSIQSHFDIQRQYSSSTGEQTNVISENGSDRPWYDRDYVRIDWSSNQVDSGSDYMMGMVNAADISLAAQQEGGEPTWFVERDANGNVEYIDVLNTYVIEPDYTECALTFGIPLWGSACGPETIEVRTSMVKITEESDYIPREYSDWDMNDFGWFQTHRPTWDERYGARDSGRIYLANRFDIWENSLDSAGNEVPYEERTPQPLVYYLNDGFPESLKATMFEIATDYDSALRRIVATYQGVDVPNEPGEMSTVSYDDVPQMFYLCDNPGGTDGPWEASNAGYESGHCQRPGTIKNIGDIRFSFAVWINHEQLDGPLGYGPSSVDVVTGEIFSGRAYIYGAAMNTISQYALDISKIISGDLDVEEYAYGRTIQDYFSDLRADADDDLYYGYIEEASARADHIDAAIQDHLFQPRTQAVLNTNPDEFRLRSLGEVHPLRQLEGTSLEQLAIFPEVQSRITSLEQSPFGNPTDDIVDTLSISRLGDPVSLAAEFESRLDRFLTHGAEQDCVMMAEVLDPSLIGMSSELAAQREVLRSEGKSESEIDDIQWDAIRNRLLRFVMAHEIGHNFGMMHNFSGSFDALNYHKPYWDLREETFNRCDEDAITFANNGFFSGNIAPPSCEGGEDFDEYNQRSAEMLEGLLENNIRSYQFSSVMDYTPRYYNNAPGLGQYDYAALAYVYGELRTVFDSQPHQLRVEVIFDPETDDFSASGVTRSDNPIITFDDVDEYLITRRNQSPQDTPFLTEDERDQGLEHGYEFYHYSTLPIMFDGDVDAMYDRSLVPEDEVGEKVIVPFRFCSDYYRGTRTECTVFDQGADFLEVYQDVADSWDGYYYLSFFRRDRAGFGLWLYPILSRMYNYTMMPMTRLYQHWLIRAAGRGPEWYGSEFGGDDATTAAYAAIDFLGNVITQPTIGTYYFDEEEEMFLNLDEDLDYRAPFYFEIEENIDPANDYFNIGADVGRYGFEQFRRNDQNELGHWGFVEPEILSWFWAKWASMMALVLPTVDIIGQDTSSDSTAFSIPIYLIFPEQMTSFFGAMPREDFDTIGNCVVMNDGKAESIVQRNLVTGAPAECEDENAEVLNPFTSVYGRSDFNMRLLSILYGSAYFQTNYDMSWFDLSNVYIFGRGYTPELGDEHNFETFTDDNGLVYAAAIPNELDDDVEEGIYVGVELIRRANELMTLREEALEANDGVEDSDYYGYDGDLGNLIESMRLLNQANEIFEGYNVFMPSTL